MSVALYPWEIWFGRTRFFAKASRDYRISQISMAQQIRVEASRRGLYVRVEDVGDGLLVQVSREPWREKQHAN